MGLGDDDNIVDAADCNGNDEMKAFGCCHDALATDGCIRVDMNIIGKPVVLIVFVIQILIASSWLLARLRRERDCVG
jgi:hypothetical protein